MVKHDVEPAWVILAIRPNQQVLWVCLVFECALEIRMLSVILQIPGYDINPFGHIIDQEDLN